jgi:hypothetical protein
MNKYTLVRFALVLAFGSIVTTPISVQGFSGSLNFFTEVGDAGNTPGTAQSLTGGPYDGIIGSKNDINDIADYYAFAWGGGNFIATFSSDLDPTLELFNFSQVFLISVTGTNFFMIVPGLAAGNYIIGVTGIPGPGPSPYAVTFNTPIAGVPEPASAVLILIGLAATYVVRIKYPR